MSRNGTGTYTLPGSDFTSGTVIASAAVNAKFTDIASALTSSIAKDGQTSPTADMPMANFKHTSVANAAARTQYASAAQVQDGAITWGGTAAGTANALTCTLTPGGLAYVTGMRLSVKAASANTGATTININALGAKDIRKGPTAGALTAGDITAGEILNLLYDGTQFIMDEPAAEVRLLTSSVTAGAAVDLTLPSYFSAFRLICPTFSISNAGASLYLRTSIDNGSSFAAGVTDYGYTSQYTLGPGSALGSVGNAASGIDMTGPVNGPDNRGILEGIMQPGTAPQSFLLLTRAGFVASTPEFRVMNVYGNRAAGARVTTIRLLPTSGNLTGTFILSGIR